MVDIIPNYGLAQIHCMMLGDEERLNAFNQALSLVEGKTVLDYGAGTGILSMMAARAGAKKVYAIEPTNANLTRQIIKDNGLEGTIEIIENDVFDADLPKVDTIVSEWMGVWALQENMLPGLLYVRDNFLKRGGEILPNRIDLYLVPSSEPIDDIPDFTRVHDFNLGSYLTNVRSQPSVSFADSAYFLSDPKRVHSLSISSMSSCDCTSVNLESSYLSNKDAEVTCLYGWFIADFYGKSALDTSPKTITHWQQARFLPEESIHVSVGDEIKVKMDSSVSHDKRLIKFRTRISK